MSKKKTIKRKKNVLKKSKSSRWLVPGVILVAALIGGYFVLSTFAATYANCQKPSNVKLNYCVNDSDESKIVRLYYGVFNRKSDKSGLNFWVGKLRGEQGKQWALRSISAYFLNSSEFERKHSKMSDSQFVSMAYRQSLGRSASSSELKYWVGRLSKGDTRGLVLVSITESSEAKTKNRLKVADTLGFRQQWVNRPAEVRKTYSIILVAGQSNAVGSESYAQDSKVFNDSHPVYKSYQMAFKNYSPNDKLSPTNLRTRQASSTSAKQTFGPEIGLSRKLYESGKKNVIIVKVAEGGIPIYKGDGHDWNVSSRGEDYDDFVKQTKSVYKWVEDRGATYRVDGLVWMQGESDTLSSQRANAYYANISNFWKYTKRDLRLRPNTPMVIGKIELTKYWDTLAKLNGCSNPVRTSCVSEIRNTRTVQGAQQRLANNQSDVEIINTSDLPRTGDFHIHFSNDSQIQLGRRFGQALLGHK